MAHSVPNGLAAKFTRAKTLHLWLLATLIFAGVTGVRLALVAKLADAKHQTLNTVLSRWDAVHYIGIAKGGYFENMNPNALDGFHSRLAFFPLFPFLLRLTHEFTTLDYVDAAFALNFVASVCLAAGVMAITAHMGAGRWGQIAAGILVVGAPMSLTYNMPYTEALFTALSVWALWAMLSRRWALSGALVFLACLTRLTGVDLWLVFLTAVVFTGWRNWQAWLALVLSPLGMIAYITWVNSHTSDVGGYFGLQKKGWNSQFDWGEATIDYFKWIFTGSSDSWIFIIGVSVLLSLAAVVLSAGKLPWPVWLFAAGVVANIVLSDGTFTARPRLLMPAILCLLPVALRVAESYGRIRLLLLGAAWVAFGALISAHPLLATGWAI